MKQKAHYLSSFWRKHLTLAILFLWFQSFPSYMLHLFPHFELTFSFYFIYYRVYCLQNRMPSQFFYSTIYFRWCKAFLIHGLFRDLPERKCSRNFSLVLKYADRILSLASYQHKLKISLTWHPARYASNSWDLQVQTLIRMPLNQQICPVTEICKRITL